jgi:hypothetical protein
MKARSQTFMTIFFPKRIKANNDLGLDRERHGVMGYK